MRPYAFVVCLALMVYPWAWWNWNAIIWPVTDCRDSAQTYDVARELPWILRSWDGELTKPTFCLHA